MTYAVRFDNVTKRYSRGGPRYASLRHHLSGAVSRLGQRLREKRADPRGTLALEDVSFEVKEGESFAIIGPNGAGKTTALKLISRISYPTRGDIRVRGRVGALIEVGSGIHPELNGRENVWLYGRILGMGRTEVGRRFDEIVEFAELGHVLDTPVKMYSSGMQLRLGFAIASHLDPDVFVVDEALAVGDAGFQAKCVERMTKLVREGHSLIFVSHNLSAIEAVCQKGVFLSDGQIKSSGSARAVLSAYQNWIDTVNAVHFKPLVRDSASCLQLISASCHDADGNERYSFATGENVSIRLRMRTPQVLRHPHVSIGVSDGRPGNLVLCSMLIDGGAPDLVNGDFEVACLMEALPLLPRVYQLWCSVRSEHGFGDLLDWQCVGAFRISGSESHVGPAAQVHISTDGPVYVKHSWRLKQRQ